MRADESGRAGDIREHEAFLNEPLDGTLPLGPRIAA